MPSALILLAEGTEEMEFTITYDVLVRGGVSVTSALVGSSDVSHPAKCSRGVCILGDTTLDEVVKSQGGGDFDAVIVPGGVKGAETMAGSEEVQKLLQRQASKGKIVAAICAGSLAIKSAGVGKDSALTSHPSVKDQLDKTYHYSEERVVAADNLITSRGPGTAFLFALTLVEKLSGADKRSEIEGPMILSEKL